MDVRRSDRRDRHLTAAPVLIPVKDENPRRYIRFPYVTCGLIAACTLVYLWQLSLGSINEQRVVAGLGVIPAVITGVRMLPPMLERVPPLVTLVTSMFLHGGFGHLFGNMLFLWIFGDNVEDACGHLRFLVFYLVSGIGAALIYIASDPVSMIPVLGASGAISGVLGAYLVLHPRSMVVLMIFFGLFVRVPAAIVLGLWIALQIFSVLGPAAAEEGVAWWAHIGGFAVGALLILGFRRRGVRLFAAGNGGSMHRRRPGHRSIFSTTRRRR